MSNEEMIRRAVIYAEYFGGLGDALLRMYFSGKAWYEALDDLFGKERAVVVLMSHNKNLSEVFRWHPNAGRITVIDLGFTPTGHPWENREFRLSNGLPEASPCPPHTPSKTLKFYPPDEDLKFIEKVVGENKKFIVMAATASTDERTIPEKIRHEIARHLTASGLGLVVVGNSRYFHGLRSNDVPVNMAGVYDAVDKLTVPGTIELIKKSAGVVTAHSSMLHAAWHEHKPVFLLYNRWMKETMIPSGPVGYMQGINRQDTDHMEFSEYAIKRLVEWLEKR